MLDSLLAVSQKDLKGLSPTPAPLENSEHPLSWASSQVIVAKLWLASLSCGFDVHTAIESL